MKQDALSHSCDTPLYFYHEQYRLSYCKFTIRRYLKHLSPYCVLDIISVSVSGVAYFYSPI